MSLAHLQSPTAPHRISYRFAAGGRPGGDFQVVRFRGREAISELYAYDIDLCAEMHSRAVGELLGETASFTIASHERERVVSGIIASVDVRGVRPRDGLTRFSIRLVPRAWVLTRRRDSRIFQNMTVDRVIAAVCAAAQVPVRFDLANRYPVREYCTQYEESDYEFISRLMSESAMFFHFDPPVPGAEGGLGGLLGNVPGASLAAGAIGGVLGNALGAGLGGLSDMAASALTGGETLVVSDDASAYPAVGDQRIENEATSLGQNVATMGLGAAREAMQGFGAFGEAAAQATNLVAGAALRAMHPAPSLPFRGGQGMIGGPDAIVRFAMGRRLRATRAVFRTYDPEMPQTRLAAREGISANGLRDALESRNADDLLRAGAGALGDMISDPSRASFGALGADARRSLAPYPAMEVYEHHANYVRPRWDFERDEPKRILKSERRRSIVASGSSFDPTLSAARRFRLDDHPDDELNREWVLTAVEHEGRTSFINARKSSGPLYRNSIDCVPAEVPYVHSRSGPRRVHACLTATVVGPPGEEIWVDHLGRIKVKFHWDRSVDNHDTSCWMRTVQAWGGASWGTQFIPRVGMEVLVAFEGGDPDRPIVIGSVNNGTHPPAFQLPRDKTRSGIRTQTVGGEGANELAFEDAAGREQIYVHATRDLDTVIERNHTSEVRQDETRIIHRDRRTTVDHDDELIVNGESRTTTHGDRFLRVEGNREVVTQGAEHTHVFGDGTALIDGTERREVRGLSTHVNAADMIERVNGHRTTVVGQHGAERSFSLHVEGTQRQSASKVLELESDGAIVLRCGDSFLRITADKIELDAKEVHVRGSGAFMVLKEDDATIRADGDAMLLGERTLVRSNSGGAVSLNADATIDGGNVKLKSSVSGPDHPSSDLPPPTTIELVDENGHPLANQRFLLLMEDGTQTGGVLDGDGKATVHIEGSAQIVFPGLPSAEAQ